MSYIVSQLFIYPIKSLAGIEVIQASFDRTGFLHDRRWMLVDETYRFISQREIPVLCLFQTSFTQTGIQIQYKADQLEIPLSITDGETLTVTIWEDKVAALLAPNNVNTWFSKRLSRKVYLVYMPDQTQRSIDPKYAHQQEIVSFADGFPLLLIGNASLQLLQSKLTEPISMNRFRPNIVFSGGTPHCEDEWTSFQINQHTLKAVKPCARCLITTINQDTSTSTTEPLRTLATYRKKDQKILFGQNVLAPIQGHIAVGMPIFV
jgi:uncharacterized protein